MKYSILVTSRKSSELVDLFKSIEKMDFNREDFEVVATYEEEDKPLIASFRVVKKKIDKKGIPAGRNACMELASGDIFVFTDSDCRVPENWLKILDKYMPQYDAIAGNARIFYETKFGKYVSYIGYPAGGNLGFSKVFPVKNGYAMQLSTCNAAIKAGIAKNLKFDESLAGGEDKDISIRLIEKGYKIKYAPDWYIYHPSKNYLNDFAKWMYSRGKHAYFFIRKYGKTQKKWMKHMASIFSLPFPLSFIVSILFALGMIFQFAGYMSLKLGRMKKHLDERKLKK